MKQKIINFSTLFFSVYFILYILPFPISGKPIFFENIIVWFGKKILQLDFIRQIDTGSGDTTFDYVKIFFILLVSFFISIVILFFKSDLKNRITILSMTYSRYFLVFMLLTYGFYKFGGGQFSGPTLFRLEQKLGDISPMAMLWMFMGSSTLYSAFSGVLQIISGLLLLYKRTFILGAILAFGVMLNVMILNFCYDVPVKIFSIHLVAIILFILHKNLKSIISFLLGYPSRITYYTISFIPKKLKMILKGLMLIYILYFTLFSSMIRIFNTKESETKKLDAVYIYDDIATNKSNISSVFKWKKIIIDNGYAKIYSETDTIWYSNVSIDESRNLLLFKAYDTTKTDISIKFKYDIDDKLELFEFGGTNDRIGKFNKFTKNDYELTKREFNWINEFPYNK